MAQRDWCPMCDYTDNGYCDCTCHDVKPVAAQRHWRDVGNDEVAHDIPGLRTLVYCTCVMVVLACLLVVILLLWHEDTKPVVPQHDSESVNHVVPQYGLTVLPHCYLPCTVKHVVPQQNWRTT